MPNLDKKIEMNVLTGLSKNAGWLQLVSAKIERLAELQRDIMSVDISRLMGSPAEVAHHCSKLAEAQAIISLIEYPERKIKELQTSLGEIVKQKGGDDTDD